jgi:glycosyltransferase involved in cell wall biosynthesis
MKKPQISIITVCFNAVSTIQDCIESILNQSIPVEHIIIDGCSTDGTIDIIEKYQSGLTRIISEPDQGIYDAMNKGIKLSRSNIIGILNADDLYYHSRVIEKVLHCFTTTKTQSCYGDLIYVDPINTNKIIRYWKSGSYNYRNFYWGWMPPHPTFFTKRTVYEKLDLFKLNFGSAADYELMLRFLVKHRISATYLPEILVRMRTGGTSNFSMTHRIKANRNDNLAWKTNNLTPLPWTILMKPLRKIPQYFQHP